MKTISQAAAGWRGLFLAALIMGAMSVTARAASKFAAQIDHLFTNAAVPQIEIEIPEAGIKALEKEHFDFNSPNRGEKEKVEATVRAGGVTYQRVSLQLKGAAGSFQPIHDKPAFTLNFDKFVKDQRFHGLDKISLNNSVQDRSYIHEQLARELFLKAGVPAPRVTHAEVKLNGRDLGLYVLAEGWDREFLKQHFNKTRGNLYDGGFVRDITDELSTNAGENPADQSDRKALAEAAKEPDLKKRLERLQQTLDLERFLKYMAMDVILWNWDGYAMNKNNWRLYHDQDTGKMIFMPHGLDQMLQQPGGSVLPPMRGLAAAAVMEVPELRQRYFQTMKTLAASVFQPAVLTNRVMAIDAKIRPLLAKRDAGDLKEHDQAVARLMNAIPARSASLERQLAKPVEPVQFRDGVARLTGWESKKDFGKPSFQQGENQGAAGALEIGAKEGSSVGSWRTSVWLERGRYKIEGRLKTEGIVGDPGDSRPGAGFRVKQGRPENYTTASSGWKQVETEFRVNEPLGEMQLLCEFRGAAGQAWFDLDSIRLRRIDAKP